MVMSGKGLVLHEGLGNCRQNVLKSTLLHGNGIKERDGETNGRKCKP